MAWISFDGCFFWLHCLTIITLSPFPSYRSINVVWFTNDINISCQRQISDVLCVDRNRWSSLLSLYLIRIVLLSWGDERMILIPSVNDNLRILHGMDSIYWCSIICCNPWPSWLALYIFFVSYYYSLSLSWSSLLSINVVWWTNDIDTSCQQPLIYFAWHGLHCIDVSYCNRNTWPFCMAWTLFIDVFFDHNRWSSLLSLYLRRIVPLSWGDKRII